MNSHQIKLDGEDWQPLGTEIESPTTDLRGILRYPNGNYVAFEMTSNSMKVGLPHRSLKFAEQDLKRLKGGDRNG